MENQLNQYFDFSLSALNTWFYSTFHLFFSMFIFIWVDFACSFFQLKSVIWFFFVIGCWYDSDNAVGKILISVVFFCDGEPITSASFLLGIITWSVLFWCYFNGYECCLYFWSSLSNNDWNLKLALANGQIFVKK